MECSPFITPNNSTRGSAVALDIIQEFELSPLDIESAKFHSKEKKPQCAARKFVGHGTSWRGPLRVLRLIFLVAFLPTLFIAVPIYRRYYVFSGQLYPVGMTDMRLLDKKVSTTWCQRQVLYSNATFNAFLMSAHPTLAPELVPVSMTRELNLEDDMKEYWGFYLLQGSSVTVSTCVRWPGASLIMIRGHKHLQECAYIGDDSSEELDEILRANGGRLDNATIQKLIDQPANRPDDMTRHLSGVKFHLPRAPALQLNASDQVQTGYSDEKATPDSEMLKQILGQLKFKQEMKKSRAPHRPSYIVPVPELIHRHRETNINEDEGKWLSFKDLDTKVSEEGTKSNSETTIQPNIDSNEKNGKTLIEVDDIPGEISQESSEDDSDDKDIEDRSEITSEQSSSEIFEDIFKKLNSLGVRGKNVLSRLNEKLVSEEIQNVNMTTKNETPVNAKQISKEETTTEEVKLSAEDIAEKKIETLRILLEEIMEEQKKSKKAKKRKEKEDSAGRRKRELLIEQTLQKELNEEDEKGNAAIEEGFEPDGIADHHVKLNETTLNDMSRSEFWSSFSSSEEALLECDGLILNLPLIPHKSCEASKFSEGKHSDVSRANTVTYRVPSDGYYFFVFNSENEVQTNYIRVKFDMQKTIYDLSKGTVRECKNSTEKCAMSLDFFSEEKVVFEVPLRGNDSLWNEEFVVISECEPRTSIYFVCIMTVPVLIIMAFY